jgi:hypothetical protein
VSPITVAEVILADEKVLERNTLWRALSMVI